MSVLITGGAGFIASHFINTFSEKYPHYKIVNLDKLCYCSNVYNVREGSSTFIRGDIQNEELISHLIKEFDFEVVFHFAAQSHVDNSFSDPVMFTRENVVGTHTLIETFRVHKPSVKFIHFSTDEVYGTWKSGHAFTENDMLSPTNPYSASKAAAEMIVQAYITSFNMDVKIIRCNNVYGRNQYPEKLIPKFIKLLQNDQKCTIHGDNSALIKRAFIHVDDVVDAVLTVHERGASGEIYNISSEYEFSVLDVTKLIVKSVKGTDTYEDWIIHTQDRPFNDERYFINSDKLSQLGWKQKKDEVYFKKFIDELTTVG